MDFNNKSNTEVIKDFLDKIQKGEKISVQDVKDAVASRSVTDPYAAKDALTVFLQW